MPELPEVESLRRSLMPFVLGQKITKISVFKPKLVSDKGTIRQPLQHKVDEFILELTGQKIQEIERIAKNLIFRFESGKLMIVHLKMTGQLVYKPNKSNSSLVYGGHPIELSHATLPNKHSHVIFEMEQGTLYFNDTRMFGYLLYFQSFQALEKADHFTNLGKDPFDSEFTLEFFKTELKKRKSVLKSVFLSQEVVIGLGNIYCDEVCFEAKVLPTRICNTLTKTEVENLYKAIIRIIPLAVSLGGSSIANYLLADGSRGNYAREHKVYNRASKACLVCGNILEKKVIGSRTTVFCKVCQK